MKSREMNISIIIMLAVIFMAVSFVSVTSAYASSAYTDKDDAAEYVLDKINNHESSIVVEYDSESKDGSGIAKDIFEKAIQKSGIHDYMEYGVYSKYSIDWTAKNYGDGVFHFTIKYDVDYKMTESQSNAFEAKLNKTVAKLNLNGKSDKAKVKKIYKWITKNVKYDKKSSGDIKYTAYAALNKKKAVCQGYSLLFYRMCEEAGVEANIITGVSHNENHAWNIVKIGKNYKNVDATWDAGKKAKKYKYFLKTDNQFRKDHKRSNEYSSSTFYKAHPMAQ